MWVVRLPAESAEGAELRVTVLRVVRCLLGAPYPALHVQRSVSSDH